LSDHLKKKGCASKKKSPYLREIISENENANVSRFKSDQLQAMPARSLYDTQKM